MKKCPSYKEICKDIRMFLQELSWGDSGTFTKKYGKYDFFVDYRVHEGGQIDLTCAQLFYKGDEIRRDWLEWSFTEAKPEIKEPDPKYPDITDWSL